MPPSARQCLLPGAIQSLASHASINFSLDTEIDARGATVTAFPVLLKDFPVAKDFPRWSDKILRNQKSIR
jgi:hypothetical protein